MTRWILAIGGLDYEDVRLTDEQWPKVKVTTLFGQVPMLNYGDDVVIYQTYAIQRFLARKVQLLGRDEVEEAKCDMICEHISDFWNTQLLPIMMDKDKNEEKRQQWAKELFGEKLPKYLRPLEEMLDSKDFFLGKKISLADLVVVELLRILCDSIEPMRSKFIQVDSLGERDQVLKEFPNVLGLMKRVENYPGLKQWLEKRPKNEDENF